MSFCLLRLILPALGIVLTARTAYAQQDLTINYFLRLAGGTYHNVTIQRGGDLDLTGPLTVTGRMVIQAGGRLESSQCSPVVGPGSFELQDDGELSICQYEGITRTAAAGAIQVTGTRTYAPGGHYVYYHRFSANGGLTGDGLPPVIDRLTMRVGTNQLNLTTDVTVRERVSLLGLLHLNGHRLTLASDATATAYLTNLVTNLLDTGVVPGPGGTVVVQRYLAPTLNPGLGYRHLSVPMTGQNVAALGTGGTGVVVNSAYNAAATATQVTPFPTVFSYDERRLTSSPATDLAAFDKGWVSPVAPTDALTVGRGYTVQARGGQTLEWSGELVGGDVAVPLTRNGGANGGWHLVGNPYPGPINWRQVTIPTGMSGAIYVYESTAQYGGRYRSYVNGVGNPIVPLGQAFFVRVSSGAPTLTFTNNARVNNSFSNVVLDTTAYTTPVYRGGTMNPADPRPLAHLTLSRAGSPFSDEAYVYFEAGATAGVDDAYDAVTMQHDRVAPTLYSQAAGTELSINGLPVLTSRTVVPLGLDLPAAGSYTLQAAELRKLAGADVYLHDVATGQDVDLQRTDTYRFIAPAGPLVGRFSLRFEPTRPTETRPGLTAASVSVYPNPAHQDVVALIPAIAGAKQVHVTLLNSLGQQVRQQTTALPAAGTRLSFDVAGLPAGVYTLRLQAGEAVVVKQVVVE